MFTDTQVMSRKTVPSRSPGMVLGFNSCPSEIINALPFLHFLFWVVNYMFTLVMGGFSLLYTFHTFRVLPPSFDQ
jgi:hypothetical protein